jgi:hypothetical protein
MPFEHEIALCPPVAQLTGSGSPKVAEWRSAIRTLLDDPDLPRGAAILCDLRAVTLPRRPHAQTVYRDLLEVISERPTAFVVRAAAVSGMARQISTRSGGHVQVFANYTMALRWVAFGVGTSTCASQTFGARRRRAPRT